MLLPVLFILFFIVGLCLNFCLHFVFSYSYLIHSQVSYCQFCADYFKLYLSQTQIIWHFQPSAKYFYWVSHHLKTQLSPGTLSHFTYCYIATQLLFLQYCFPFFIPYSTSSMVSHYLQINQSMIKSLPQTIPKIFLQPIFYFCFLHKSFLCQSNLYALLTLSEPYFLLLSMPFPPHEILLQFHLVKSNLSTKTTYDFGHSIKCLLITSTGIP